MSVFSPETRNYESIIVADSAIGFDAAKLAEGSKRVFCTLETAQIRFRTDGVDPTSSEGHLLEVGDVLPLAGKGTLSRFRVIRVGVTSGLLKVSHEK